MKPHKGMISLWYKYHFDVEKYRKEIPEQTLGYIIMGRPSGHPEFRNWIKTSPVIKHEGNVIETLNSIYELVGERKSMDSSWQAQYERWGILTNGYRKANRDAYQQRRTLTLIERKRRELAGAENDCPIGRIRHLWAQVDRMENLNV